MKHRVEARLMFSGVFLTTRNTTPPKPRTICENCNHIENGRLGEESFSLYVNFTSSGDTSQFTDDDIRYAIAEKCKTINL